MGAGVSGAKPAYELSVKHDFDALFISAGYVLSITRHIDYGNALNVQAGHRFWCSATMATDISVGYARFLKSAEHKELNAYGMIYQAAISRLINGNEIGAAVNYFDQRVGVILRITYNF